MNAWWLIAIVPASFLAGMLLLRWLQDMHDGTPKDGRGW